MSAAAEDDGQDSSSSLEGDDPLDRDWLSESLQRLCATRKNESSSPADAADAGTTGRHLEFKIVTWNIWFSGYEWKTRLEAALYEILKHCPTVFCFQEVTTYVHKCMLQCRYLRDQYEPVEDRLPHGYDCAVWVKKMNPTKWSCDWVCSSIPLQSIYGRRGLCVDLDLVDTSCNHECNAENQLKPVRLRIMTTHLESGEKMAATRRNQLAALFTYIRHCPRKDNNAVDASFLLGDFNLDPSYSENELVDANGLDLWKALRPNDPGFTEETYKNKMRYLAHGRHKQVRYDRAVLIPQSNELSSSVSVHPQSIDLLGTKPFDCEKELWPSDHFGLVAQVDFLCAKTPKGSSTVAGMETARNGIVSDTNDRYTTP